jgi:hypothetical protein
VFIDYRIANADPNDPEQWNADGEQYRVIIDGKLVATFTDATEALAEWRAISCVHCCYCPKPDQRCDHCCRVETWTRAA